MSWGSCGEWELFPQHSLKHLSWSLRTVTSQVIKLLGLRTSTTWNHKVLVVGTWPTQKFPYHHPWLLEWGPMQYGRIPLWTYNKYWKGLISFKSQWAWLGLPRNRWPRSWMDPNVHHYNKKCSLGTRPCPCRRSLFPGWHIDCTVTECEKPTKYDGSVSPKYYCRWICHPNTQLKRIGEKIEDIINHPHEICSRVFLI